jgi:pimeloyl-ACP methyl ester carboxylesterase
MPVLLTWSEPGSKIEWGLGHFFKVPGCEMHLFPWSGHHVQTDQRDRWVQVVTNWLQNEPARPPEKQYRRRKRRWKESWIDVDGVHTRYIEAGDGDPFVLIHGGGFWGTGWGPTIDYLSDHFHAISPDIIGAGMTLGRGPEDYSGQAQGEFLIKFIEKIDLGPVYLSGQSHGGYLSQYIAHRRPDLVRRLIISNSLNGTHPIPPLPEGKIYVYGLKGHQYKKPTLQDIRRFLERYYEPEDITDEMIKTKHKYLVKAREFADKRGKTVSFNPDASNINLSYRGKHISKWASELKIPVMLLWSEPGSKIDWALSHFFKVPGCEAHFFPWSGHGLHRDQVERWVQVATNWIMNPTAQPPN